MSYIPMGADATMARQPTGIMSVASGASVIGPPPPPPPPPAGTTPVVATDTSSGPSPVLLIGAALVGVVLLIRHLKHKKHEGHTKRATSSHPAPAEHAGPSEG